jgi:hypothetical protein
VKNGGKKFKERKKEDRKVINGAKSKGWDERKEFCLSTLKQAKGDHVTSFFS